MMRSGKEEARRYRGRLAFFAVMLFMLLFTVSAYAAPANKTTTLWRGETRQLSTSISGRRTWTSMNSRIATVNSRGIVRGLMNGTAVIQVTNGRQTQQFPVKVIVPKLNYISVRLKEKNTWQLSLSGLNASWLTGNKKVAVVSSSGLITARNPGTTVITARYAGFDYTCKLTVFKDTTIRKITINRVAMKLYEGDSGSLYLTVTPSNLQYLAKGASWKSSNPKVARVSNGTVKAVNSGTATITVRLQNLSLSCKVTVSVNPNITTLSQLFDIDGKGGTYYLKKDLDLTRSQKKLKELRCTLYGNGHQIKMSDRRFLIYTNKGTIVNLNVRGGALAKLNNGVIDGCKAYGQTKLTGSTQIQYGIVEENRGTIRRCRNYRGFQVLNNSLDDDDLNLGGIAIINRGTIRECSNLAPLSTSQKSAGIAVWNYGNIVNCLNTETIDGRSGCGISCFNNSTLNNCLNVGRADYAFCIPGRDGLRLDCYYLTGKTRDKNPGPDTSTTRIRRLTRTTIKSTAYFPTFNFSTIWVMKQDGPMLR